MNNKGLTKQQREDVELLIHQGGHTLETAICEVLKPKTKVRAPNLSQIEEMGKRKLLRAAAY